MNSERNSLIQGILASTVRPALATVAVLLALSSAVAQVPPSSFQGTFSHDDEKRSFYFTLASQTTVTFRTESYAGGTSANGQPIASGGFDPTLSLYDSAGALIANNRDGGCGNVPADPGTGNCWDALITVTLPKGSYQLVVTSGENLPNGPTLADAFVHEGQGDYTTGPGGIGPPGFWDASGTKRSGNFSLDVTGPSSVTAQLVLTSVSPPSGQVGVPYSSQLTSTGGTGTVNYVVTNGSVPTGLTLSASGLLSGTPTAYGTFDFTVQATDSATPPAVDTRSYQVVISSASLTITTSSPLPAGVLSRAYGAVTFASSGGLNVTKTWALVTGSLPAGMTFSAAGVLQGTPTAKGSSNFTVSVTDGSQTSQKAMSLSVFDTLVITTSFLPGGTQGSFYGPVSLAATGGSGSLVWSATGLPSGTSITSAGVISGTAAASGNYSTVVTATDALAGQTATSTYPVSIATPILTLAPIGDFGTAVGGTISKQNSASGGKPPYTWSAAGLPSGVAIDAASGLLSGSPTTPGKFTFTITATDTQGLSASSSGTLSVLGIVSTALPDATTTAAYSQAFSAVGGTSPYAFSGTGIPEGLTLSSGGALTGTPKNAGTFAITIQVTDATGVTARLGVSLKVTAPANLSVSAAPLSSSAVGTPYSDTVAATGASGSVTWSVAAGSLPDGLSLSPTGTVNGTPTKPGTYSFTARAVDSSGSSATGAFTVNIAAPPLTVGLGSLPNGFVGTEYSAQIITPEGGVKPYNFTLAGNLPPGLTFADGQIKGTPTAVGLSEFTITTVDSSSPALAKVLKLSILVNSNSSADLALSASSGSFSITTGSVGLPDSQAFTVRSSIVAQPLTFSAALSPAVSWATLTSGNTTPGDIKVALTNAALSLPASSSDYTTSVVVSCTAPSPCAGKSQTIGINLTVTSPPPVLSVATSLLSFAASASNPTPANQSFAIENKGGGSVGIKSLSAPDSWLVLGSVPGSVTAGAPVNVTVGVNTSGLKTGYYRSTISIQSSAGSVNVPVGLFFSREVSMNLSPGGAQFQMQTGGVVGNPSGSFLVSVSGNDPVAYSAAVLPGAPWLSLGSGTGNASASSPGSVTYSINSDAAATLAPNAYYGVIRVTSGSVSNSPQDFNVILNVTPASDPVRPDPQPAGLIFISSAPDGIPSQTIKLYASSKTPVPYQASAATDDGGKWLTVTPTTGVTSSSSPAQLSVGVNLAGLPQGVYRGGVSFAFSAAAVRTVNVTLIIQADGVQASTSSVFNSRAACAPAKLVPTQTGITTNFAQPAAWPTALTIKLVDDCGTSVPAGQVVMTFSNGDPPLALPSIDKTSGVYAGTWTPRATSSQITITARATATGFTAATTVIKGQVTPNAAPALNPGGTLNAFGASLGAPLGPGSIVQIYGTNLSAQPNTATSLPLPQTLGGTRVIIGGKNAPLYYASSSQVNAQIPVDLPPNEQYQVVISANGALSTPDTIQLTDVAPGIATFANGAVIAQHLDGSLVLDSAPAKPGEFVIFYLSGLGVTDNPVDTGQASPGDVLAHPTVPLQLTLNGTDAPVAFVGLTPGLVGLYQINFQIPGSAPDGTLDLLIQQQDILANKTLIPVKK